MDLDLVLKVLALAGIAVAWGDLRRQVRVLADEVRIQNGRITRVEDKADASAESLAALRGYLRL